MGLLQQQENIVSNCHSRHLSIVLITFQRWMVRFALQYNSILIAFIFLLSSLTVTVVRSRGLPRAFWREKGSDVMVTWSLHVAISCLAGKGSHVICNHKVSSHVVDRHVLAGKSCVPCILKEENSCRSKNNRFWKCYR